MNKEEIIYLACPYSHKDAAVMEERWEKASYVAGLLIQAGFTVYSPVTHGAGISECCDMPKDYKTWKKHCLSFLSKSGYLLGLMLDGWEDSIGYKDELSFARKLGLPIVPVKYEWITTSKELGGLIRYWFNQAEKEKV